MCKNDYNKQLFAARMKGARERRREGFGGEMEKDDL